MIDHDGLDLVQVLKAPLLDDLLGPEIVEDEPKELAFRIDKHGRERWSQAEKATARRATS